MSGIFDFGDNDYLDFGLGSKKKNGSNHDFFGDAVRVGEDFRGADFGDVGGVDAGGFEKFIGGGGGFEQDFTGEFRKRKTKNLGISNNPEEFGVGLESFGVAFGRSERDIDKPIRKGNKRIRKNIRSLKTRTAKLSQRDGEFFDSEGNRIKSKSVLDRLRDKAEERRLRAKAKKDKLNKIKSARPELESDSTSLEQKPQKELKDETDPRKPVFVRKSKSKDRVFLGRGKVFTP